MARSFDPVHFGSPRFRTAEHGPFLVTDARFPAGLVLPPHEHERTVIAVTLDGGFDSVMCGRPHVCLTGTVLIEPAGERHGNHFARDTRVLILQPDLSRRHEFEPCARALDRPVTFASVPARTLAQRLQIEVDAPDSLSPLSIEASCLELIALTARTLVRSRGGGPPR